MFATIAPFATLVILLVWMGFFMLGSLPLMILKHDTPLDARFVRGLFDVYYKAVIVTASAGVAAQAWTGKAILAVGMAAVVVVACLSRLNILTRMDRLRAVMTPDDGQRIRQFRVLHVWGMVLNVAQLLAICLSLVTVLRD